MNTFITTTLSLFNMQNIKPNFSVLSRVYNIDRHTLKKIMKLEVINHEK